MAADLQEYKENPNASAWVMAHAGSGKTHALVRRVVALLLAGAVPRSIWCVTYTNIAASEMSARITTMLGELSAIAEDVALKAALEDYLQYAVSDAQVALLRDLARNVHRADSRVSCTTMHGLCQMILRVFAFELGLSPQLVALDEEAMRGMLEKACASMLTQAMAPDHPAAKALLHALSVTASYKRLQEHLQTMVQNRRLWLDALSACGSRSARDDALLRACGITRIESEDAPLRRAHAATPPQMHEVAAVLSGGTKPDREKSHILLRWLHASEEALAQCWEDYRDVFLKTSDGLGPRKSLCSKIILPETRLGEVFYAEQQRVLHVRDALASMACAEDSIHMAALFDAAYQAYSEHKAQAEAIDFDDMIFYVQRLLSSPQSLGYVMDKLDVRVEHILLDEAQDTAPAQWHILSHLVEDLCAARSGSAQPKTVFVVGDTKQSIYSFQGAAPWMMQAQQRYFQELFATHQQAFSLGKLSVARRSVPKVLAFVDAIGNNQHVRAGWMEAASAHRAHRDDAGRIVSFALTEPEAKKTRGMYAIPRDYSDHQTGETKLAQQIASDVAQWLEEKRLLTSAARPVCPGDIMILVRKRGKLAPAILRALQARGVPVAGMDRVVLSEHIVVQDILALIAWCFQVEDDLALAQILRSPIGGFSEEDLCALAHGRSTTLWQALQQHPNYTALCDELSAYLSARSQSIYSLLVQVMMAYQHMRSYRARLGDHVVAMMEEVFAYASALEGTADADLLCFMMRMKRSRQQIKRDVDAHSNVVRILTVHGAKGLEANIVMIADVADMPSTQKESIFSHALPDGISVPLMALQPQAKRAPAFLVAKQSRVVALEQEYYRQLYVALTRARDELYLYSAKGRADPCEHSWYALVHSTLKTMEGAVIKDDGSVVWEDVKVEYARESGGIHMLHEPAIPFWAQGNLPQEYAPLTLTPSQLARHDTPALATKSPSTLGDPRVYGNALHALLSWATPEMADDAMLQALHADGLNDADQRRALQTLHAMWQHPEIGALLAAEHFSEQAVSAHVTIDGRSYPAYGIIDRLVMLPDAVMILDFKTAETPPPPNALPDAYLAQLGLYHAMLTPLYPQASLKCALLWTHNLRLDVLPEAQMHKALHRVTKNLTTSPASWLDDAVQPA